MQLKWGQPKFLATLYYNASFMRFKIANFIGFKIAKQNRAPIAKHDHV